ncbi:MULTISPECIES: OmpA family protein [Sphingobacterium]|uniref:OmpA family protein n=1 Tax=Sphingobacterium TaxID=28453 RepID=UPI0013D93DCB|nr:MULTISPECIES: OmpA family protein [unclassified Sphingobacterium]
MKKTTLLFASAALMIACNNSPKQGEQDNNQDSLNNTATSSEPANNEKAATAFDISNIPVTTTAIGDFPFINLPKGLEELNKPLVRPFDVCFFPIDGVMTPFEGKLYKTFVSPIRGEEFSQHFFEKSMAEYLQSVGAVKIFDGEITKEEYDRYNKQDPHKGGEGDIGYAGQNIKFWALRTKDKGNIYIQYLSNNAGASLNVLQEEAFQQTITKVTADEIAKDLNEKGKSILYINFDIDKADLTTDGKEVTDQIAAALKKDAALKITVEGHTDNTGDATHNKKLSQTRAESVVKTLVADGIDKSRLLAKGFGAERPLVANDSEENKAKNRRVELIKTN